MAKILRAVTRHAGNPQAVHRRWLGIERLESRAMLHGDDFAFDFGPEFETDFEFDNAFVVDDFSADDCFHADGVREFGSASSFDSNNFYGEDYSAALDDFLVSDWESDGEDARFENRFGGSAGQNFWDRDAQNDLSFADDFWNDEFQLETTELQSNLIAQRPPLLIPDLERPSFTTLVRQPIVVQTSQWPVKIAFATNHIVEPRESLILVILAPKVVSVDATDAFHVVSSSGANNASTPTPDNRTLQIDALGDGENALAEAAATIEAPKSNRSAVAPQTGTPRSLGLEGMLPLDQGNSAADVLKQQSNAEAEALEIVLDGRSAEASEEHSSLDAGISARAERSSQPSRKTPDLRQTADSLMKQQRQNLGESVRTDASRRDDLWLEGMLSLDMVPAVSRSQAPLVASLDALALVQLFIHADEDEPRLLDSSVQAGEVQSESPKTSLMQKLLKDRRVSTVASIALGIVAIATARRTSWRDSKRANRVVRKNDE